MTMITYQQSSTGHGIVALDPASLTCLILAVSSHSLSSVPQTAVGATSGSLNSRSLLIVITPHTLYPDASDESLSAKLRPSLRHHRVRVAYRVLSTYCPRVSRLCVRCLGAVSHASACPTCSGIACLSMADAFPSLAWSLLFDTCVRSNTNHSNDAYDSVYL